MAGADGLQGAPQRAGADPRLAQAQRSAPVAADVPDRAGAARFSSAQLFGSAVEVEIEHRAQIYRLRRTAMGKLILTK